MRKIMSLAAAVAVAGAIVATPGTAHAASGTTYLFTTTGGYWQIWKTWQSVGGGKYNGSWGTHSSKDGGEEGLAFRKSIDYASGVQATSFGSWTNKANVRFRVCDLTYAGSITNCSGWW